MKDHDILLFSRYRASTAGLQHFEVSVFNRYEPAIGILREQGFEGTQMAEFGGLESAEIGG